MAPDTGSKNSNTLSGYDIVLSLSQEAINAQFRELYDKPLPSNKVPLPAKLAGHEPVPEPEFYINHHMKIVPPLPPPEAKEQPKSENGVEVLDTPAEWSAAVLKYPPGIRAHIECPYFEIHPTNPNTLIMSIKFKALPWTEHLAKAMDEDPTKKPKPEQVQETNTKDGRSETKTVEKSLSHSWLAFLSGTSLARVKIDGWKISWEVDVGTKDIENVLDFVKASNDPHDSTNATPESTKQLESKFKVVDASKFTAASIFCLFETTRISKSFAVLNEQGKVPTDLEQIATMTFKVAKYFSELQKVSNGKPTAENPYLLGYAIKAIVPKLEAVNADLKTPLATPAYFIPRRFDMTTTPSLTDEDKKLTAGTLNFCMQTFRADAKDQIALEINDVGKGIFKDPFFNTIATPAIGTTGINGVMGLSREIIVLWLMDLIEKFKPDPNRLLKAASESEVNSGTFTIYDRKETKEAPQSPPGAKIGMTCKAIVNDDFTKLIKGIHEDGRVTFDKALPSRRLFTVDAGTLINYTSDLQNDRAAALKDGAQRRMYVRFYFYDDNLGFFEGKFDDAPDLWANIAVGKVRSHYWVEYILQPGEGGVWSLTKNDSRSNLPAKGQEVVTYKPPLEEITSSEVAFIRQFTAPELEPTEYTELTLGSSKSGMVVVRAPFVVAEATAKFKQKHANNEVPVFHAEYFYKEVADLAKATEMFLGDTRTTLGTIFDSLRTTVILPAGNIFTFSQTDTDSAGHVYIGLFYRAPTSLQKT